MLFIVVVYCLLFIVVVYCFCLLLLIGIGTQDSLFLYIVHFRLSSLGLMNCIHYGALLHLIQVRHLKRPCTLYTCTMNLHYTCTCTCISHSVGGIGFSLHEIGISLSIVGVILLPFTFSFFPLVSTCIPILINMNIFWYVVDGEEARVY